MHFSLHGARWMWSRGKLGTTVLHRRPPVGLSVHQNALFPSAFSSPSLRAFSSSSSSSRTASLLTFFLLSRRSDSFRLPSPRPCGGASRLFSSAAAPQASIPPINYYKRLQISPSATPAEVKTAYRQLALRYHPDVAGHGHDAIPDQREGSTRSGGDAVPSSPPPLSKGEAEAAFRRISEAYAVLSDKEKRKQHDEALARAGGGVASQSAARRSEAERKGKPHTTTSAGAPASPTRKQHPTRTTTTTTTSQKKTRTTTWSSTTTTTTSTTTFASSLGKRASSFRPGSTPHRFLRKDADAIFRQAFDGKSLEDVLFAARRHAKRVAEQQTPRQRPNASQAAAGESPRSRRSTHEHPTKKEKDTTSTSSSSSSTSSSVGEEKKKKKKVEEEEEGSFSMPHEMEKEWDTMQRVAERWAARMQRTFGQAHPTRQRKGVPLFHAAAAAHQEHLAAHIRRAAAAAAAATASHEDPATSFAASLASFLPPPPSGQLPFRPFPHMILPDGVTVPEEPVMGPWAMAETLEKDGIAADVVAAMQTRREESAPEKNPRRYTGSAMAEARMRAKRARYPQNETKEMKEEEEEDKMGKTTTTRQLQGSPPPPPPLSSSSLSVPPTTSPSGHVKVTITTKTRRPRRSKSATAASSSALRRLPSPSAPPRHSPSSSRHGADASDTASTTAVDNTTTVVKRHDREESPTTALSSFGATASGRTEEMAGRVEDPVDVPVSHHTKDEDEGGRVEEEEEEWEEVPPDEAHRMSKRANLLAAFRKTSFADRSATAENLTFDRLSQDSGKDRSTPYNEGQMYSYHRPF